MEFSQYDGKIISLTDTDGRIFTGTACTFQSGYGLCEYNREEEGIQIGEYVFFDSYISKIEEQPALAILRATQT